MVQWNQYAPSGPFITEGTFRHSDLTGGGGFIFGGTVDVSYGGITTITSYPGAGSFSPHVIEFPAGIVLLGDMTYSMTLSATSTTAGGGYMAVQVVELATNIQVAAGPDHFFSGSTPGSTVYSGSVDFGAYPFTMPADARLNLVVGAGSGNHGVTGSHWEVEVQV